MTAPVRVFTTGRDYRPRVFFGDQFFAATQYVRVLVAGRDIHEAARRLELAGMSRYQPTLREPTSCDGPAAALGTYLTLTVDVDKHPVFVLTATRHADDGSRYAVPRFHLFRLVGDQLVGCGRVRVVSRTQPPDATSVVRVVADDDRDDPVPMPTVSEVPATETGVVEGVLPFPAGGVGKHASNLDRDLAVELERMVTRLADAVYEVTAARTSSDPTYAWIRDSAALEAMGRDLVRMSADARFVETVLRLGTD